MPIEEDSRSKNPEYSGDDEQLADGRDADTEDENRRSRPSIVSDPVAKIKFAIVWRPERHHAPPVLIGLPSDRGPL